MRKLLGQFGRTIAESLIQTTALIFMLSPAVGHAQYQCWNGPVNPIPQDAITLSPKYWAPGHSYNVVLTSPGGYFPSYFSAYTNVITAASFNEGNFAAEDPNVTADLMLTYVSPTQVTFNVTVAADAGDSSRFDAWDMRCVGLTIYIGPGAVQVTPCAVPVAPGPLTVQPGTWVAGQQTAITITGSGFIPTDNPDGCVSTSLMVTAGSENVRVTNVNVVSSTQITAIVQPQITDPMETATITVSNYQYNDPGTPLTSSTTAQIVPTTCIVPHISSISPNVWFAGHSYRNVAFTGTNFTTPAKATATCPATTVSITTDDGEVTVSGINVSSSTRITGTVRVASDASTEGATAVAYGDTTPVPNADVLGAPDIIWANDPDGSSIIGGPDTELYDPSAVVGQQIQLTTTPTAATLAALPIPLAFSANPPQNPWQITGTAIGGYPTVPSTEAQTSGNISVTPLASTCSTSSTCTLYWVSSPSSPTVSYNYTLANGQTSTTVTATFDIDGPSAVTLTTPTISPVSIGLSPLRMGVFVPPDTPGIVFDATLTQPQDVQGTIVYVQYLNHFNLEYTTSNGCAPFGYGPGIDGFYPIDQSSSGATSYSTNDSPSIVLYNNSTAATASFQATMYLMWQPSLPSTPVVPVPLGSITWQWSGEVEQSSGTWSFEQPPGSPSASTFAPSASYPPNGSIVTIGNPPCGLAN